MAKNFQEPTNLPRKANKKVNLQVDLSKAKMTIGILDTLAMFETDQSPTGSDVHELISYFDKVVVGGVKHIPMEDLPEVAKAVMSAMRSQQTAKN